VAFIPLILRAGPQSLMLAEDQVEEYYVESPDPWILGSLPDFDSHATLLLSCHLAIPP